MWILENIRKGNNYFLLPEKTYIVGRKDCHILIDNDPAISRKHAIIVLSEPKIANSKVPIPRPIMTVEDQSKFGTYINNVKLTTGEPGQVKSGDVINFGSEKSSYKVTYEDIIATTSSLDTGKKREVKLMLKTIGGHMVSDWNRVCSHVVMETLNVTVKVICALIMGRHVITPQYFIELAKAAEQQKPAPLCKDYLPPLGESQLNPEDVSFEIHPERRTIFQGMKFIFLVAKQFNKLKPAITLGGGVAVLMNERADDKDHQDTCLLEEKCCIVYSEAGDTQDSDRDGVSGTWLGFVLKYLRDHDKRAIPEAELGYAVLYCSTHKFCNPDIQPENEQFYPVVAAPSLSHAPPSLSQAPISDDRGRGGVTNYLNEVKNTGLKPTVYRGSSEAKSTVLETESHLTAHRGVDPHLSHHDITMCSAALDSAASSRKRSREVTADSPTLPASKHSKQSKQTSPPKQTSPLKQSRQLSPPKLISPVPEEEKPVKTEPDCVKNEPVSQSQIDVTRPSQSVDLFTTATNKTTTSASNSTIFNLGDNDQTILDRSHARVEDELFGAPSHDALTSSNRGGRENTDTNAELSHLNISSKIVDTGQTSQRRNSNRRGQDDGLDEFDLVPSSRKRRRQTQQPTETTKEKVTRERETTTSKKVTSGGGEGSTEIELHTATPAHQSVNDCTVDKKPTMDGDAADFIACKQPRVQKVDNLKKEGSNEEKGEENQARNLAKILTSSLLRRKPKSTAPGGSFFNMWQGKQVKNFKKFRKAGSLGPGGEDVIRLPRIIGGSDLIPHKDLAKRDMMAKFARDLQEQSSQQEAADRETMALFDLAPTVKTKKGRR